MSLPAKLGQRLRHRLRGARLGDDHVERGRAAAAVAGVEVVDQVLVVRERVHRLDVAAHDAVRVVDGLEHGRDRIGRARRGRQDAVGGRDVVVVDAVHDVLDRALAGRGEQHAGDPGGPEVLREPLLVAPAAGVVDDDRVADAVGGVVDRRGSFA